MGLATGIRKNIALTAVFLAVAIFSSFSYVHTVHRAKETIMAEEVRVVSSAVRAYTLDRGSAPKSMDELVSGGYLKAVPGRPPVYDVPMEWPHFGRWKVVSVSAN